jgi:enoyl-CoA hydratase/carnithine racemase
MSRSQIRLSKHSAGHWTATFDHPPINLIDRKTVEELDALVTEMEHDQDLCVIVFDSADPEFFLAHYDVLGASDPSSHPAAARITPWWSVLARLSRTPVVSIASIRGCARGAGSEFALACDLRFASRERTSLGQFEVGVGAVPGGGPMARLSRLVGRGRALEILLGADDFPGDLAERYGYVNRAIPDAELDRFVTKLAHRLASFDKRAIAETKRFVDAATLPPADELAAALDAFLGSIRRPETQARLTTLLNAGLQQRSELERRLGHYIGPHDMQAPPSAPTSEPIE